MKKFQPKQVDSLLDIQCGEVLIAKPFMPASPFSRKVILITQHDEQGTTGLILNDPGNITVREAFDMLPVDQPLYTGGSVETHLVTFLHNFNGFREALSLNNGLFWGGSHDYLEKLLKTRPTAGCQLKFFAGVSIWQSGELEAEILADYWWTTDISPNELFNDSITDLRSYLLLRDNSLFGVLNDIPDPVLS